MDAPSARPTVTATITPKGMRTKVPREHQISVVVKLSPISPKYSDRAYVTGVARKILEVFTPDAATPDERRLIDLMVDRKGGPIATGVEASITWPGRPSDQQIAGVRAVLHAEGYGVSTRELRECTEPQCLAEGAVEWNQAQQVPNGWYSSLVCGRHAYKTCGHCQSIFAMNSTNAVGPAPSVPCEVCGEMLVEWGGSKIWTADLVKRHS
jgi:ribosomal protein S27E